MEHRLQHSRRGRSGRAVRCHLIDSRTHFGLLGCVFRYWDCSHSSCRSLIGSHWATATCSSCDLHSSELGGRRCPRSERKSCRIRLGSRWCPVPSRVADDAQPQVATETCRNDGRRLNEPHRCCEMHIWVSFRWRRTMASRYYRVLGWCCCRRGSLVTG
jgi:hypothetical protein